jgi:tRNA (mo5U34)-methyltransferase
MPIWRPRRLCRGGRPNPADRTDGGGRASHDADMTTLQSAGATDPEIAALGPWFHNLHLPDGSQTAPDHPLGDFPAFKWAQLAPSLPSDLTGTRALDIGCNAGFYTFELAKRGAYVVAIDEDEHYLRQAHWALERFELAGSVELRRQSVYELARVEEGFDLVLFLGVLYHLRYPLLALDLVAEKVDRLLALQTLTLPEAATDIGADAIGDLSLDERERLLEPGRPLAAFVEHRLAGDPTNWWIPTPSAVEAMARSAGLEIVARPGDELWLCRPSRPNPHTRELSAATGRL